MRALFLLLPLAVAVAGEKNPLEDAAKRWASDHAEERDHASRAVAAFLRRELAPLVAALESSDPEVRRRACAALEGLLPPRPPEPAAAEEPAPWPGGVIVNQAGAQQIRIIVNAQGQAVLVRDKGEEQRLKEMGISGRPFNDPVAREQLGLAAGRGYAVVAVEARSGAARLGLKPNDILISIDGRPVHQGEDVAKGLAARSPVIKLLRRGKMLALGAVEGEGAAGEGK